MDHTRLVYIGASLLVIMFVAVMNSRKRRQFEYECSIAHKRDILNNEGEILCVKKITPDGAEIRNRTPPLFKEIPEIEVTPVVNQPAPSMPQEDCITVMHLISAPNKPYIGYELLQALHNAGLRYGEMNIFHRHEHEQGLGRVLFSVAKANEPGTFDMENMGATSCLGLTFFMQHQNNGADEASLEILMQTLSELADDLGGTILDSERNPQPSH